MHSRLETLSESLEAVHGTLEDYYSDVSDYISRSKALCKHEISKIRWEARTEEEKEDDSKIFASCLSESEVSRDLVEKVEKILKAREWRDD